jgi:PAS domain S-box-containing protein
METQEAATFEEYYPPLDIWFEVHAYPSETGLSVYFRDVTQRKERERELELYRTIVETVDDGIYAVDPDANFVLVNDAFCEMTDYSREELLGAHATTIHDDEITTRSARLAAAVAGGARDLATIELDIRTKGGGTVPVETRLAPFAYGDDYARCGVVRDVTERKHRERELRRHREQLAALNDLNDLVQEITAMAINKSTREEIEELLCERLAAADSYEFAWVGELDASRGVVTVREEAGAEGYFEDCQLRVDAPEATDGPIGRAFCTNEVQVVQNVHRDPDAVGSRCHAGVGGYHSAAVIPISYEGTLYGVLNVYSERLDAFADAEREVLERLGVTIGHAIRSVEQRRALMAEEVVQIDLQFTDLLSVMGLDVEWTGRVEVDRTIPTRDGAYVQYVTATPDAVDALYALADYSESIREITELGTVDGAPRFEIHYGDPPITEAIVSRNGRIVSAVMVDGDLNLRAEFPPDTNVGALIDQIGDLYPSIQLVAQRSSASVAERNGMDRRTVLERLTERQRASMEAAYFAGYFDWPRQTSAVELADTMGISSPTLHQHLRKAHRKILDSLLSGGGE